MQQSEQGKMRYSIVIPAFEEAKFIGNTLQALHDYLVAQNWLPITQVIVVAAKGKDDTAELAKQQSHLFAAFEVIEPGPKVGKGRDVQMGMLAAEGQYRLFMDADLATPLHHLRPAFEALEDGADVVIGERELLKVHKQLKRRVMSIGGNRLIHAMLHLNYGDSQCGFKGFTAQATKKVFKRQTIMGWGFDIELLTIAREHKLKVARIPVSDWADPKTEASLVGETAWQAAHKTFDELALIRKLWKEGHYK